MYFGGEGAYTHIHSGTLKSHLEGSLDRSRAINFWERGAKPRHVEMEKEEHEGVKIKGKEKCG